ncbi:MAG: TlpA disulfide reductase family protein [Candidatus Hydrogenedentales bacterium]
MTRLESLRHATERNRWRGLCIACTVMVISACSGPPAAPQPLPDENTPVAPATAPPAAQAIGPVELANEARVRELLAATKGKPLVVNVWATWCMPCVAELPELAKFHEGREKLGAGFLSLSADLSYEVEQTVKLFMRDKKVPFPVYVLDSLPPDVLAKMLNVEESKWDGPLPATFLLDKDGVMKQFWFEEVTSEELTKAVASL